MYKYTHANAHLCVTLEDVIYPGKGKHCRLIVNALLSGSRLLSAALHLTVNAAHEATDSCTQQSSCGPVLLFRSLQLLSSGENVGVKRLFWTAFCVFMSFIHVCIVWV